MRRLVPLAILAAVAAGLLWRADLPPAPPAPAADQVFTDAEIERAAEYRGAGYILSLAALAVPLAVMAALLRFGLPEPVARLRRPSLVAATVALLLGVSVLPLELVAHRRAADAGLDVRSTAQWALDTGLAMGVWALAVGLLYAGGLLLVRRVGPLGAVLAVVVMAALFVAVQPLVIDPLFMKTRPIASAQLRDDLARLERRMDAHPRSVSVSDAGSRTTTENAHVNGLGPTVRIILYDTVVNGAGRAELRALLAHELAHVQRSHTLKGVLWFALLGGPILFGILVLVQRRYATLDSPKAVVAVLAAALLAWTLTLPLQNALSRRYEAEADWVGLKATGDGDGMAALHRRVALANLSHPDPPTWAVWLLFTHPPVTERIAVARAYSPSASSGASRRSVYSGRLLMPSRVLHLE